MYGFKCWLQSQQPALASAPAVRQSRRTRLRSGSRYSRSYALSVTALTSRVIGRATVRPPMRARARQRRRVLALHHNILHVAPPQLLAAQRACLGSQVRVGAGGTA